MVAKCFLSPVKRFCDENIFNYSLPVAVNVKVIAVSCSPPIPFSILASDCLHPLEDKLRASKKEIENLKHALATLEAERRSASAAQSSGSKMTGVAILWLLGATTLLP